MRASWRPLENQAKWQKPQSKGSAELRHTNKPDVCNNDSQALIIAQSVEPGLPKLKNGAQQYSLTVWL